MINDDNLDKLLVAAHDRRALVSPEFSKRCQQAGVTAVTILKLINAFKQSAQWENPFDRISEVSVGADVPIEMIESVISLPPGFLKRLQRTGSATNVNALRQKDPTSYPTAVSGEQCMLQWLQQLRPYGSPEDQESIDAAHKTLKGLLGEDA